MKSRSQKSESRIQKDKAKNRLRFVITWPRQRLVECSRVLQGTVREYQHIGCVALATVESVVVLNRRSRDGRCLLSPSFRALKRTATFSWPLARQRKMRNHDVQSLSSFFWILDSGF
jgi:hypothetical protein